MRTSVFLAREIIHRRPKGKGQVQLLIWDWGPIEVAAQRGKSYADAKSEGKKGLKSHVLFVL
ncbi:hypothetical protein BTUL_0115g00050 [Botrytis tulipae]|uniref:Uncharacterized protein n=1 Tax=Botrytis tulipae TaxID=87230 RepID=A0A4Z1EG11_9HELO|nr:hypothetical protein BTUL_0115g00050 [Botrytis tulipae]